MWGPRTFRDADLERKEEENMRVIIWLNSRPGEGEDLKNHLPEFKAVMSCNVFIKEKN